jgi:hypothetical protein
MSPVRHLARLRGRRPLQRSAVHCPATTARGPMRAASAHATLPNAPISYTYSVRKKAAQVPSRAMQAQAPRRGAEFLPIVASCSKRKKAAHVPARAMRVQPPSKTISAHLYRKIAMARGRADGPAPASLSIFINDCACLDAGAMPRRFFGNVVTTSPSGVWPRYTLR